MRILRPAREEDVAVLIEIARRAWLSAFSQSVPFALVAAWVQADRATAHYRRFWPDMLLLEQGGEILGLVQPARDPRHHGTGAGTQLLRAGEDVVLATGHPVAWLSCSVLNTHALDFYRRRGYVETGRATTMHPIGLPMEDVRMERRL